MFGLVPKNNYKTGETTTVTTARTKDIGNNLLIIDEASMLEPLVLKYIDENTSQAKVILVGDDHQLPPVKCRSIPAFSNGFPTCTLTEPMRQDKDSHLFKELMKLREAVTNKEFYAPQEGEGITYLDGIQFKDAFLDSFRNQEDARLLAYANKTVEQYNGFIRKTLHGTDFFEVGDIVVAANCCNEKTKVEGTYRVEAVSENIHKGFVPYRHVTLDDGYCYQTPVDKQEYFKIIKRFEKEAKQDGRWSDYFELKGNYLDIRDGFACTVNKSQGSTYDKVFIDLQNISQCRDPYTLTRLIYVAFSRAKKEVIIYRG
jgi:ATP-dependent exoDNAse (exonuclease V) alpha subunit